MKTRNVPHMPKVAVKRVYEKPAKSDGVRVLVDRLWPRGVSKAKAMLDDWMKNVAPSSKLRTWYGHDSKKYGEFRRRYLKELSSSRDAAAALVGLAKRRRVTLVYAAHDPMTSHARVLREYVNRRVR